MTERDVPKSQPLPSKIEKKAPLVPRDRDGFKIPLSPEEQKRLTEEKVKVKRLFTAE